MDDEQLSYAQLLHVNSFASNPLYLLMKLSNVKPVDGEYTRTYRHDLLMKLSNVKLNIVP